MAAQWDSAPGSCAPPYDRSLARHRDCGVRTSPDRSAHRTGTNPAALDRSRCWSVQTDPAAQAVRGARGSCPRRPRSRKNCAGAEQDWTAAGRCGSTVECARSGMLSTGFQADCHRVPQVDANRRIADRSRDLVHSGWSPRRRSSLTARDEVVAQLAPVRSVLREPLAEHDPCDEVQSTADA